MRERTDGRVTDDNPAQPDPCSRAGSGAARALPVRRARARRRGSCAVVEHRRDRAPGRPPCSPGASCCGLFGCRSGDGALARACLTDVVREAGAATPEIRVDLPGDGEHSGALWLTAAPLPDAGRGIVVQLRQGDRRDRRRRTDPHWVAGPQVRICALGRTEVSSGETQLGGRWLAQRPGQLLKYLVSQRTRSVLQDEIAYALWPENGYDAQSNVRHTMHQLRRRLEPRRANRAPSEFLVTREGAYSFARDRVTVDADEFEALARAGLAAVERDPPRARERLDAALELYRGDFLADEPYAEWALDERDRLRDLATARTPRPRRDGRRRRRPRRRLPAPAPPRRARAARHPRPARPADRAAAPRPPARRPAAATTRCGGGRCASSARSPASSSPTSPTRSPRRRRTRSPRRPRRTAAASPPAPGPARATSPRPRARARPAGRPDRRARRTARPCAARRGAASDRPRRLRTASATSRAARRAGSTKNRTSPTTTPSAGATGSASRTSRPGPRSAPWTPSKATTGSGASAAARSISGAPASPPRTTRSASAGSSVRGQAGEAELAVELDAVLVGARDDQRALAPGAEVGGDPRGRPRCRARRSAGPSRDGRPGRPRSRARRRA